MTRAQLITLLAGACALVATLIGFFVNPEDFFRSYLFAFLFCAGLSLGAWGNLMLHEVTGGRWGVALQVPLLAAARLVPLNLLLFLPLLFGLPLLYPWIGSTTPEVAAKAWWLNTPFFVARAFIYLSVWGVLAWRWVRLAASATELRPPALRRLSALGLIVYGLTVSLAAVDWIMSLMPRWYSSTFGLLIGVSQMLSGMALGVAACAFKTGRPEAARFHDFGNLLLMYVMSWAYLAFTQFLIIWAADLPNEIAWYVPRVQTSWRWVTLGVFAAQFALPFVLLLFRVVKRTPPQIGRLALWLLLAQLCFYFYLVTPVLYPHGWHISVSDVLTSFTLVALWVWMWLRSVRRVRLHPPPALQAEAAAA